MATIPSEESYGAQSPLQANYELRDDPFSWQSRADRGLPVDQYFFDVDLANFPLDMDYTLNTMNLPSGLSTASGPGDFAGPPLNPARADSEPSSDNFSSLSPSVASPTNGRDRRNSAAGSSYGTTRECPAEGCPFRAKSKKDVDRHYMSVHAKADLFFCPRRDCTHKRGWSRKDARDRHVKTVHGGATGSSPGRSSAPRAAHTTSPSHASPTGATPPESESRATTRPTNFTVEDVMSQLEEEKRLRLDLEHELRVLRRSYDERASLIKRILSSAL